MALNQKTIHEHFRWKAAERLTDMLFDRFGDIPSTSLRYGVTMKFNEVFNGNLVMDDVFFDSLNDYLCTEGFDINSDDEEFLHHTANGMREFSELVWSELQRIMGI